MTPSNLENYVRQRYNAVGDNFFPQPEILNYFYAAQMELASETMCIQNTYTATTVVGQRAYSYPNKAISIMRVEYDGERIRPSDFITDDSYTGNNADDTGQGIPFTYQIWGDNVYLRPLPSAASTLKILSYDMPSEVTIAGTLEVPTRYHMALADYALYCMFAKDKNLQMASYHKNIWDGHKAKAKAFERQKEVGDEFRKVKDTEEIYADWGVW